MDLCGCRGRQVGAHVGGELILGAFLEAWRDNPELIIPHIAGALTGLDHDAAAVFGHLACLDSLRQGHVAHIEIAHEVATLYQQEVASLGVLVVYLHRLPIGGERYILRHTPTPSSEQRVDGAGLRGAHFQGQLVVGAFLQGKPCHGYKLHLPPALLLGGMHAESVGVGESKREGILLGVGVPAHRLVGSEVLGGHRLIDNDIGFGIFGSRTVLDETAQPGVGLLGMPGERVTIDTEPGGRGIVDKLRDATEAHVTVLVDAAAHLHSVAADDFVVIIVGNLLDTRIVLVVIHADAGRQHEVGIFRVVNILLQGCIVLQVVVVGIARYANLIILLRGSRREAHRGCQHGDDRLSSHGFGLLVGV